MYHATSQDFQIVVNLVRVSTETVQQMIDSKHLRLSQWHCSIYGTKPWWVKVIQISQHPSRDSVYSALQHLCMFLSLF